MPTDPLLHHAQADALDNSKKSPQTVIPSPVSLPEPYPSRSKLGGSGLRDWLSLLFIVIAAGFLVWFIPVFIFQQYQVDGISMQPTLNNDNRLVVSKIARSWSRLTGHPYIPKRGDIVIFIENDLYNLNTSGSNQLVKRVIGLPGDRVVIKNGAVAIYNKQYPQGFDPDTTLPYAKAISTTSGNVDVVVPPGQIFVCGDNRGDSLDSRVFGTVPVRQIVGQLVLRITPLSEIEKF